MITRTHTAAFARAATRTMLNRSCAIGALTLGAIALPQAAFAQNECGVATGTTVTCTTAGNPYPNGVTYVAPPQDLTIVVNPNVIIDTTGTLNTGILAIADPVNSITVNAGTGTSIITTGAGASGILANTTAGNATVNASSVATSGAAANAVDVRSLAGNASASVGTVTTLGAGSTGLFVLGATGATATVGSVTTSGDNANGVNVASTGGPVTVTNNGSVGTTGLNSAGILATGAGNVTIAGTGSVSTTGANAPGVQGLSTGGPVSITTGAVTTTGANSVAVSAVGTSANVTANGTVTRSGTAGAGPLAAINVQGTSGAASANVGTVTATGAGLSGVLVNGATTASATVRAGGIVNGSLDALNITSLTGSTVANAGTLNTGTGYAIRATGGAATITSSGTINGRVLLTGGNDTFANSGTFNATQASDFGTGDDAFTNSGTYNLGAVTDLGAGNDSFVNSGTFVANAGGGLNFNIGTDSFTNSGTLRVLPGTAVAGTTSFAGLESFGNSGTIDLRNGHTGDVLSLGTAAYSGSGDSTLALDVNLGGATPTADRLVTGAATGSTRVVFGNLTTGVPSLNPGILLVQAGAGSTAGAFTLANGQLTNGFANYSIAYNGTDFGYRLVAAPSTSAFRTLTLVEGMRNLSYASGDAWSGHMTSLRDAAWRAPEGTAPVGSGLWMTMYGQSNTRRNGQEFSTFGVSNAADIGYKQDAFGGQIGFDFGSAGPDGGAVFGITGGYLNSTQGFPGSSDLITYDVANVGAYVSYVSGSFFANALGKYDHFWIGSHLAGVDNSRDLKGHSYGAQGEIGFRFGGDSFFAEPVASVAYVRTSLDDLDVPGFSFDFDGQEGLRGKAGLRLGSGFNMGSARGLVYASGMAVHEFQGRDNVGIISGGQTVVLGNDRIGTYGQGTLGFSATTANGVTGFIEGFGNYGDDYRGGGGRAGLRVNF